MASCSRYAELHLILSSQRRIKLRCDGLLLLAHPPPSKHHQEDLWLNCLLRLSQFTLRSNWRRIHVMPNFTFHRPVVSRLCSLGPSGCHRSLIAPVTSKQHNTRRNLAFTTCSNCNSRCDGSGVVFTLCRASPSIAWSYQTSAPRVRWVATARTQRLLH